MVTQHSFQSSPKARSLNSGTTRRDLLKMGSVIAAASGAAPLLQFDAQAWASENSPGQKPVERAPDDRLKESYELRVDAAKLELEQGAVLHPANADEAQFPNGIASFTKGLPHGQLGETDVRIYQDYLTALGAGSQAALDALVLGGKVPLVNPLAGLAFDLEGADSRQLALPAAPSFSSAQRAAESVEV